MSLLQEYVKKHGTDGLNKKYVDQALANGGGNGATAAGIYSPSLVDNNFITSFLSDSRRYLQDAESDFGSVGYKNASSIYSSHFDRLNDLKKRRDAISMYLKGNKDKFDEEFYNTFTSDLDLYGSAFEEYQSAFKSTSDFYSQFETEQDYNDYVAEEEDRKQKLSFDLNAGKKELDDLYAQRAEARQTQHLINGLEWQVNEGDSSEATQMALEKLRAQLKQYGDIDGVLTQKEQYYNQAKHLQEGEKLRSDAVNAPDFEEYSQKVETGLPGKITPTERYMSDEQTKIYNYYLNKYGEEKADEYLYSIEESVNAVRGRAMADGADTLALQYLMGAAAGLDQFASGVKSIFSDEDYINTSAMQFASGMVREDLADTGPQFLGSSLVQVGYDIINTTANMAPSILAGTIISAVATPAAGAAFGTTVGAKIGAIAGKVAGASVLGASAGGNAYAEKLNAGYNKEQAAAYGKMVAASEAGLQYLLGGISKMGGKLTGKGIEAIANNIDKAVGRVAVKWGLSMLSEGAEEYLQEVLTPWYENIVFNMNNDVNLLSEEALYAGLLGALSAGVLEGGSIISADRAMTRYGKALKKDGLSVERLKSLGQTFAADTVAYELAGKVDENTGAYTIARLFNEVNAQLSEQNKADIVKSLERKGYATKHAEIIANQLAAAVDGAEFGALQRYVLDHNEDIAKTFADVIVNPNSTVNQRRVQSTTSLFELAKEVDKARVQAKYAPTSPVKKSAEEYKSAAVERAESMFTPPAKRSSTSSDPVNNTPFSLEELSRRVAAAESMTPEELTLTKADAAEKKAMGGLTVSESGKVEHKPTGKEIGKLEIVSGKDKKLKLKTESGEVLDAKDVNFRSKDEAMVYSAVLDMGVNPVVAQSIVDNFDGTDGMVYAADVKLAYQYGKMNFPKSLLEKLEIKPHQAEHAYKLGRSDAKVEGGKKKRKVQYKQGSIVNESDVNEAEMNPTQKASLDGIKMLANLSSAEFHIFEGDKDNKFRFTKKDGSVISANGMYITGTNEIWIDLNAGNFGEGTMIYTVAHEISHYIRQWSPAKWQVMADFLLEQYGEKGVPVEALLQRHEAKVKRRNPSLKDNALMDAAYEEMVSDALSEMLVDGRVAEKMQALKKKDASLWEKIKDAIKDLLDRWGIIRAEYAGRTPDADAAQFLHYMDEAFIKLQDMYAEAFADADANFSVAGLTVDNSINMESDVIDSANVGILGKPRSAKMHERTEYLDAPKQVFSVSTKNGKTDAKMVTVAQVRKKGWFTGTEMSIKALRDARFKQNGFTKKQIDAMNAFIKKAADAMAKARLKYRFIGLDDVYNAQIIISPVNGSITISAMVKNGDYAVNFDFTKICKKRVALQQVIEELAMDKGRLNEDGTTTEVDLSSANIKRINDILASYGVETACLCCFVESKRYNMQSLYQEKVIDVWNRLVAEFDRNAPYFDGAETPVDISKVPDSEFDALLEQVEKWKKRKGPKGEVVEEKMRAFLENTPAARKKLRFSDLVTATGRTNLHKLYPQVESLVLQKLGTAAPKSVEAFTPYNGEIDLLEAKSGKDLVKYIASIAGVRSQSFSDFMIAHVFDVLQKTASLSARKLPAHTYTKEIARAMLFGMTGEKHNMSVLHNIDPNVDSWQAGLSEDGQYLFSDYKAYLDGYSQFIQSIGWEDAVALQNTEGYSKDCGVIAVGFSYLHMKKIHADPDVRQVIGYHTSDMPVEVKPMTHLDKSTDYTPVQNTLKFIGFAIPQYDIPDGVPSYATPPQDVMVGRKGPKTKKSRVQFDIKARFAELSAGKTGAARTAAAKQTLREMLQLADANGLVLRTGKAKAGHGDFNLYEDLEKTGDPYVTTDHYIEYCIENGWLPMFYEFALDQNYYKDNFDFNVFDRLSYNPETGLHEDTAERKAYAPQTAVHMLNEDGTLSFPEDFFEIVDKQMQGYDQYQQYVAQKMPDIMRDIRSIKDDSGKPMISKESARDAEAITDREILAHTLDSEGVTSADVYSRLLDVRSEFAQTDRAVEDFEESAEYKAQTGLLYDAILQGDPESGVKAYGEWEKSSGYGELVAKRDSIKAEMERLEKLVAYLTEKEAAEEEKAAVERSGLNEEDYFRKQAVKEFGYTPHFYDAGYITPNGKMLNFSGEKGRHFGTRGQDHRAIGVIYSATSGTDAMVRFMRGGNIRIMAESPGLDMTAATEPTAEQYATIRKFVSEYDDKGFFFVDFSDDGGVVVGTLQYDGGVTPARVINDIKHYYATGEIRQQSNLSKFRYSLREDSNVRDAEATGQYADGAKFSERVTDKDTLAFLNEQLRKGEVTKVYRAMQAQPVDENGNVVKATVLRVVSQSPLMVEAKTFGKNGKVATYPAKLFSPMAGVVNGKWGESINLNAWEQTTYDFANARPQIDKKTGKPKIDNDKKNASYGEVAYSYGLVKGGIDDSGKTLTPVPARYNPYIHTSLSALNDQFSSANKRPELVTVECIIPNSELTSGYRAEGAKDRVGAMSWHSGPTSSRLAKVGKARTVILTRYDMPVRVLPDSEVAKAVADYIGDTENIAINGNTVTPSLSMELTNLGISVLNEEQWAQYNKDFPTETFGKKKTSSKARYSDRDADYMAAVERGDMDAAQRMVDEAAKKAGYTIKAYHGTGEEFTKFYTDIVYVTANKKHAEEYGRNILSLYVKADNPYITKDGVIFDETGTPFLDEYGEEVSVGWLDANPDVVDYLVSKGYDAAWDEGMEFATVFNTENIKSADPVTYDDTGAVIPLSERFNPRNDDIRYSDRDTAPTFYSHMARVVDDVKQEKLGAASVVSMLRGKGVKAEEIKWSGIEAWLEGKKSVTKAELQEFVRGSMLQIDETVFGGGAAVTLRPQRATISEESNDLYVMRGGGIYDSLTWDDVNEVWESDNLGYSFNSEDEIIEYYGGGNGTTRWGDYKLDGGDNYREIVFRMPDSNFTNRAMQMHWGEDARGVLAHARIQDMPTADGKMLFVEEIQSDWHNEGHKSGYGKAGGKTAEAIRRESEEAYKEFYAVVERFVDDNSNWEDDDAPYYAHPVVVAEMFEGDESHFDRLKFTEEQRETIRAMVAEEAARKEAMKTAPSQEPVPYAPYSDTYHEFVLKRLIRMAAEEGYNSIGWTTADIQTKRWSKEFAEGYRIEYDQDIPKFLNKYGKKWGAKVGKTTVETGKTDADGNPRFGGGTYSAEVWSMPITDAMKQSVLYEGQPLYSDRDTEATVDLDMRTRYEIVNGIEKGININDSKQDFTSQILSGAKTVETRKARWSRNQGKYIGSLDSLIGKRVALVRTGKGKATIVGYATVGTPTVYKNKTEFDKAYKKHLVSSESDYYIDGVKLGYPLTDVVAAETQRQIYSNDGRAFRSIMYSDRDIDSVSNRDILANAFMDVAQNDIERGKIAEYQEKIKALDEDERKLRDIRAQLHDLSFSAGPRDNAKIRELREKATKLANRIGIQDKQLLRLEASKPLMAVLEREKKLAYSRASQKWEDRIETARTGRSKTEMRNKIKKIVGELNNLLLHGTKDKHIMIGLQKATAEALSAINMDTVDAEKRLAKIQAKIDKATDPAEKARLQQSYARVEAMGDNMATRLTALKNAYEEIKDSSDPLVANAYQPEIEERIKNLRKKVGDTPLRNMSMEQLEFTYDTYKMVLTTIRNANKAFKNERGESIAVLGNRSMEEIERVGGKKTLVAKAVKGPLGFAWSGMKPTYAFKAIGSDTLSELFSQVRAGEDVWATDANEAEKFYSQKTKQYHYDSWDLEKEYTFTSKSGKEFKLTLEQIMSLYAYSKRKQADAHLDKGGFVFDSSIEVVKRSKLGIPIKYEVNVADAHNLSREALTEICKTLTDEQVKFVDEMQDYLSTVMGEKGNEVSLKLYGVKLFKEKFYFPLKSAKQFMYEQYEVAGDRKIKNSGFSKDTTPHASNPVILSNFTDVWATHVNDMAMYHAFVLPMEDFERVFNYQTPAIDTMTPESVKGYLQNAYGRHPEQYIKQLMTDLNGGARIDPTAGIINKGIALFKKSAVFASLSVVIQQPSAIARAMAYIDAKYFVGKPGLKDWDEVKKYAPVAIIKEMGYFDTNMGKSTVDFIKAKEYEGTKAKMKALVTDSQFRDDILSKAPSVADKLAWCQIWNAVKREVAETKKLQGEELLKAAGKRFTEVIVNTQVYDSVLTRSGMMRSKDTGMKMATSFMAEPITSLNMIVDALIQGKRGNKGYARKTIGAVAASMILNSILVSFVYAGRDDDEDKTYAEKYAGRLTSELIDSFNPLTLIPFVKDIVSIAQGYDVERSDMAVITDLFNAWKKLSNDNLSVYRKVEDFGGAIASIFGLPLKNIMRDVRGIYNTVKSAVAGPDTTGRGMLDAAKESLPKWMGGGERSNADQLYAAMLSGDTGHVERLKARFKDDRAFTYAVRDGLVNNDKRITAAAKARAAGNQTEYMRLAREIVNEGHFSQDDVVRAVNYVLNSLTKKVSEPAEATKPDTFKIDEYLSEALSGDQAEAELVKREIIAGHVADGKTEEEALKSFNNSFKNTAVKGAFTDGDITMDVAIAMLQQYGGVEAGDAYADVQYWQFKQEHPDIYVVDSWFDSYYEYASDAGIGIDVYMQYRNDVKNITGEDKKARRMAAINALPLSAAQKDALYFDEGWVASKLHEAPWR